MFLYREANILRALVDQVKPSRDGKSLDPLFEPVLRDYERIIFMAPGAAKRQSVVAALTDLSARMNPDEAALAHAVEGNRKLVWGLKRGLKMVR